ncbi:hypothetical protein ABZS66_30335 [Dactylosporangium sp. NPDC005572]|uniref:hypothetical protein n=1 Tax=Dactylosporangium sp. NPDC005572 TaxID=3156889 RepID=UPI0033A08AD8
MQQQLPPPQVVEAPGATVTVRPPVAVVPIWPEKLSMAGSPSLVGVVWVGHYHEQQLVQQQLPPPQVVEAPPDDEICNSRSL